MIATIKSPELAVRLVNSFPSYPEKYYLSRRLLPIQNSPVISNVPGNYDTKSLLHAR